MIETLYGISHNLQELFIIYLNLPNAASNPRRKREYQGEIEVF
jgi:hypothetical protein